MEQKKRRVPLYESGGKVFFEGPEPGTLVQHFTDKSFSIESGHEAFIQGKGVLNNQISEYILSKLTDMYMPTYFVRRLNMREQVVRSLDMLPLQIVVRTYAAGSLSSRVGVSEGAKLPRTLVEFYYKHPQGNVSLVTEEHMTTFGWAAPHEIEEMMGLSFRVNDFLQGLFAGIGMQLVDFKLEFGRFYTDFNEEARVAIAQEISPDTCRLWDKRFNSPLNFSLTQDKEGTTPFYLFESEKAHLEVARRLGLFTQEEQEEEQNFCGVAKKKKDALGLTETSSNLIQEAFNSSNKSLIEKGKRDKKTSLSFVSCEKED